MYIYNLLITLIFTEIREGVGIRRGSVIGDFPLCVCVYKYPLKLSYHVYRYTSFIGKSPIIDPLITIRNNVFNIQFIYLDFEMSVVYTYVYMILLFFICDILLLIRINRG